MDYREENSIIEKGWNQKMENLIIDLVDQTRDLKDARTESKIEFGKQTLFSSIVRFAQLFRRKYGGELKEDRVVENPIVDDDSDDCSSDDSSEVLRDYPRDGDGDGDGDNDDDSDNDGDNDDDSDYDNDGDNDGDGDDDGDGDGDGDGDDDIDDYDDDQRFVIRSIRWTPFYQPFLKIVPKFDLHLLFFEDSITHHFSFGSKHNIMVTRIWTDVDGRLHYFRNKDFEPAPVGYSDDAALSPPLRSLAIKRREAALETRRNANKDLKAVVCRVFETWPYMENVLTQVFEAIKRQDNFVVITREEMVKVFHAMQDKRPFRTTCAEELPSLSSPTEIFITARDLEKERTTKSPTALWKVFRWESMKMPFSQVRDAFGNGEDEMDALEDKIQESEEKSFKEKEEALNCKNFPSVSWVRRKKKRRLDGNDNNFFHGIPFAPQTGVGEMDYRAPRVLPLTELAAKIWPERDTMITDMLAPRILSDKQEGLEFSKDWESLTDECFVPLVTARNKFRIFYDREKVLTAQEKELSAHEEAFVKVFETWGRMATLLGQIFDDNIDDVDVKIDRDRMTKIYHAWLPMEKINFYRSTRLYTVANGICCAGAVSMIDDATTIPHEVYNSLKARFGALKDRYEAADFRKRAVVCRRESLRSHKSLGVDIAVDDDGFDYAACY